MPKQIDLKNKMLMENLMTLFWMKGYMATSIDDIAEKTGVSKSYIYTTYGKKGIFEEVFYFYMENYTDPFLQALNEDDRGIEAIREKLNMLADSLINQSMPKACLFVNTVVEMGNKEKDFSELNEMYCKRVAHMYTHKLRYCFDIGEISDSASIPFYTDLLMNLLFSLAVLYKTKSNKELAGFIDSQLKLLE